MQFQQFPVGFGNWIVKTFQVPCDGLEQEQINTAPPLLPKLCLHMFFLLIIGQQQSKDVLQTSILWMFQDHQVKCLNQTGYEMMCHLGILVGVIVA